MVSGNEILVSVVRKTGEAAESLPFGQIISMLANALASSIEQLPITNELAESAKRQVTSMEGTMNRIGQFSVQDGQQMIFQEVAQSLAELNIKASEWTADDMGRRGFSGKFRRKVHQWWNASTYGAQFEKLLETLPEKIQKLCLAVSVEARHEAVQHFESMQRDLLSLHGELASFKRLTEKYHQEEIVNFNLVKQKLDEIMGQMGQIQQKNGTQSGIEVLTDHQTSKVKTIDRRCIEKSKKILGKGASGTVFKGKLNLPNQDPYEVAIKTLTIEDDDTKTADALSAEMSMMRTLRHTNILGLFGYVDTENADGERQIWLILQLATLGSLRLVLDVFLEVGKPEPKVPKAAMGFDEVLGLGSISTADTFVKTVSEAITRTLGGRLLIESRGFYHVLVQILEGVNFLHGRELVHCDLKSDNILLLASGKVLISDFGIARIIRSDSTISKQSTVHDPKGTWGYMDPGVMGGQKNPDKSSDIYAVGVVASEVITGKRPFEGLHAAQITDAVRRGQSPEIPQDIGVKLAALVKTMLQHESTSRPNIGECLRLLGAAEIRHEEATEAQRVKGELEAAAKKMEEERRQVETEKAMFKEERMRFEAQRRQVGWLGSNALWDP